MLGPVAGRVGVEPAREGENVTGMVRRRQDQLTRMESGDAGVVRFQDGRHFFKIRVGSRQLRFSPAEPVRLIHPEMSSPTPLGWLWRAE